LNRGDAKSAEDAENLIILCFSLRPLRLCGSPRFLPVNEGRIDG
jgi:hypothetical protein